MSLRSRMDRDLEARRAVREGLPRYNELRDRVHDWGQNHEDPGIRSCERYQGETIFEYAAQQGVITRAEYDFAVDFANKLWRAGQ